MVASHSALCLKCHQLTHIPIVAWTMILVIKMGTWHQAFYLSRQSQCHAFLIHKLFIKTVFIVTIITLESMLCLFGDLILGPEQDFVFMRSSSSNEASTLLPPASWSWSVLFAHEALDVLVLVPADYALRTGGTDGWDADFVF